MEAIITGVAVGVIMLILSAISLLVQNNRNKKKKEAEITMENQVRIAELEKTTKETRELVKLTLGTCLILGDGMIQSGVNSDVQKAFNKKKQEVLKYL